MDVGITHGIELDDNGNMYVVDSMNSKILIFNPAGELVNSFGKSGDREEEFSGFIHEITIDNNGYIYVGGNCHVYKFSPAGAFIKRWGECGSEDGQFGAVYGIHYDETLNRIIISDSSHWSLGFANHRVQVFSKDGVFLGKFGDPGTGNGQFSAPWGITTDATGNIFVVDCDNHRVQKFDKDFNHLATFGSEGNGDGQFTFPKDIKIDSTGRLIITSQNTPKIAVYNSNLEFQFSFGEDGAELHQFQSPQYLAIDSTDNIFVTDWTQKAIMKFNSAGVFQFKSSNGKKINGLFVHPNSIVYDSIGNMYVLDDGAYDGRVQKFTNAGVYIDTIIPTGTLMASSYHMAIDAFDNLYISGDNAVDVFNTSGTYIRTIGEAGSLPGQFNQARGMDFDSSNNIYIADLYNSRVQIFDSAGTYVTSFGSVGTGNGQFVAPSAVLVDTVNGLIYVSDANDGGILETEERIARIQTFDLTTHTYIATIVTSGIDWYDEYERIGHLEMDSLGNIYVVDGAKNRIQYIASDGTLLATYGTFGSGLDKLNEPTTAAINPINQILSIVDHGNNRILLKPAGTRIFNLSGEVDAFNTADDQSIVNDYVAADDPNRAWISALLYAQGTRIAYFEADMTNDQDWSDVYVASVPEKSKVLVSNLHPQDEVEAALLDIINIYVPRFEGQDKVLVCPNANNVSEIFIGCTDGYALTVEDADVSIEIIDGEGEFWNIANNTANGFMSYSTSRLDLSTDTPILYVNETLDLTITPINELDQVDNYYVGSIEIVSNPYTNVAHSTVNINQTAQPVLETITFDQPGVYTIKAEDIYDSSLSATIESVTVLGIGDEWPVDETPIDEEEVPADETPAPTTTPVSPAEKTCVEDPTQDKCIITAYINNVLFKQLDDTSAQVCWDQSHEVESFLKLIENGVIKVESIKGESTDGVKYCVSLTDLASLNKYEYSIIINQLKEDGKLVGEYAGSFSMQSNIPKEDIVITDKDKDSDKDNNSGSILSISNITTAAGISLLLLLVILTLIIIKKKRDENRK